LGSGVSFTARVAVKLTSGGKERVQPTSGKPSRQATASVAPTLPMTNNSRPPTTVLFLFSALASFEPMPKADPYAKAES
jgi:hypothetical protein